MRILVVLLLAVGACAQEAVKLPNVGTMQGVSVESFRFVSDGPIGAGWSRPDEIARKYFHDDLSALFERTIVLKDDVPARTKLVWIFTGPRAGFTVELSSTKVRVFERYYDSMGMYASGSYPEKIVRDEERPFTGHARTLTVVADKHLALRVLVNGVEILTEPMLFDVTRHQLIYAAPRIEHEVVEGALLRPETKAVTVTISPGEKHQTMLGFGGSPSIPAYEELSEAGKEQYWAMLRRYNLLLSREYPMGSELKADLSNMESLSDATPHYYGDNFPNGEVSNFEYSRHVIDMGGSVIYEMWALPAWATEAYDGPRVVDAWNKAVKRVAKPEEYARIVVGYCKLAREKGGGAPLIVGIQNEVEQPPAVFNAMVLALRKALDAAGFTATKIHMADASFMFYGVERAKELRKDAAVWKAIDYTAVHEYDFQDFMANPEMYDERMRAMHEASAGKEFLATEICFNDPHFQEPSYRIALAAAELYHKNLTELDAVALMYCWLLLDVEQPTFGGSRSLLVGDRTRGNLPVASSFQLRVLGAYSRHVRKGMVRVGASSGDAELLTTAFADGKDSTVVMVNRASSARKVSVAGKWVEIERTGMAEENAVSSPTGEVVVQPGEIVVLSTVAADR
jgi:O-glycosyl hydrolase